MASRGVQSLAVMGAAALVGLVVGSADSLGGLVGTGTPDLQYTSPDNPWAVGAPADDAPRWQRQAFVDRSQDGGDPGAGAEAMLAPPAPRPSAPAATSGTYYAGCNEARAAGAAPIYLGQPGYRAEMDGDGDGIACEARR